MTPEELLQQADSLIAERNPQPVGTQLLAPDGGLALPEIEVRANVPQSVPPHVPATPVAAGAGNVTSGAPVETGGVLASGPTPEDLLAGADSVMKSRGLLANPVGQDELKKDYGPIFNAVAGFNSQLASTLSAPSELINEVLGLVGMGVVKPGQFDQATKKAFADLGINTDQIDGLASSIGKETFKALAESAAMIAAAPSIAAATNRTVPQVVNGALAKVADFARQTGFDLSKLAMTAPGSLIAGNIGGNVGAKIASDAYPESNVAPMVGALAGGGVAGLGEGLARTGVRSVKGAGNILAEKFRPSVSGPQTGIRSTIDPADFPVFAEQQVTGEMAKIERRIADAIDSVPQVATSRDAQTALRKKLDEAYNISKSVQDKFWSQVPLKDKMPVSDMKRAVQNARAEMRARVDQGSDNIPDEFINRIMEMGRPIRGANGRMTVNLPTLEQVRNLKGDMAEAWLEATKGTAQRGPRKQYAANLAQLQSIVDDSIVAAFPNDVSIKQAREFSIKHNNLFSRGPLANLWDRTGKGELSVKANETGDFLLKDIDNVEQMLSIPRELRAVRGPIDMRRSPLDNTQKAQLGQLGGEFRQTLRDMFREAAPDEQTAVKWIGQHQREIDGLADAGAEFRLVLQRINAEQTWRNEVSKSMLAKVSQADPQKAIDMLWAAKNPAAEVTKLTRTLRNEPEAVAAMRNGILDRVLRMTNGDSIKMSNLLNDAKTDRLMEAALDPTQYARLRKVVSVARSLETDQAGSVRALIGAPATILARIIGAKVGRTIAPGQLQAPSIMSERARAFAERLFSVTDNSELLKNAILDPKWERILLQKVPSTSNELKRLRVLTRRTFAAGHGAIETFAGDDNE